MERHRFPIIAVVLGLALVVSVIIFRRYLPYTGVPLSPKEPPAIVLAMEDAKLIGLGGGRKLWSVRAGKIEMGRSRSGVTITGISEGTIYDRGKPALSVCAGRADYDVYSRNLLLSKGIRVEGREGQRLSADGAIWNSFNSTLRSNGRISFESKWSKLSADSLVVDMRSRQMDMWNIRMRINSQEILDVFGRETGGHAN
jgi:hypothetical protein